MKHAYVSITSFGSQVVGLWQAILTFIHF